MRFFADAQNDSLPNHPFFLPHIFLPVTLFFTCHPEAKPKGLPWRFFPFASLRVRMTK